MNKDYRFITKLCRGRFFLLPGNSFHCSHVTSFISQLGDNLLDATPLVLIKSWCVRHKYTF